MHPTESIRGSTVRAVPPEPHLFLVLQGKLPLASPARFRLDGVDEVAISRGDERGTKREGRKLTIRLPDPSMSGNHARLVRGTEGWLVEDRGAKNGTWVNGERVTRADLADGDVVEAGSSFFIYRAQLAVHPADPPDVEAPPTELPAGGLLTLVPSLAQDLARLRDAARANVPIVLHGETGTGKEVVARAIHALSGREGAFVPINCGAIPANLVESELFGHKKGAFSGAVEDRLGVVRRAHRGTLLLDEIGELPRPARGGPFCACSRTARCDLSAAPIPSSSTRGSSPPPTATSATWSPRTSSARISTPASPASS